ncbi:hypothetical protein P8C59_004592 [Phyllachora maydis]|uniref:Ankyrin repeat protein n=1 Tax=Phyllachora maydis TaxID=1825666 RepID=A0AAD9I3P0_9PEZI|nr:hypothetical protein P8C59_004592 [Phyllachora maydis]
MGLLQLPNEVLCMVAFACDRTTEIAAMAGVNRRLYNLINPILYRIDVDECDASSMLWAAKTGSIGTLEKAYNAGAEVNDTTGSPNCIANVWPHDHPYNDMSVQPFVTFSALSLAAARETANLLLSMTPTVTDEIPWNVWNHTVLHTLAGTNHGEMAKLLAEPIWNLMPESRWECKEGFGPLHFAARRFREEDMAVLDALLKLKLDVNHVNSHGYTPLAYACTYGAFKGAMRLIRAGANVKINSPDLDRRTLLHCILYRHHYYFPTDVHGEIDESEIESDRIQLIEILIEKGVDPNQSSGLDLRHDHTPMTPLIQAISEDLEMPAIEALLAGKACPNAPDTSGRRPLCWAINKPAGTLHADQVIRVLLQHGAHLDASCGNYPTPIQVLLQRVEATDDDTLARRVIGWTTAKNITRRQWLNGRLGQLARRGQQRASNVLLTLIIKLATLANDDSLKKTFAVLNCKRSPGVSFSTTLEHIDNVAVPSGDGEADEDDVLGEAGVIITGSENAEDNEDHDGLDEAEEGGNDVESLSSGNTSSDEDFLDALMRAAADELSGSSTSGSSTDADSEDILTRQAS